MDKSLCNYFINYLLVWFDAISAICFGNFNFPAIETFISYFSPKIRIIFSEILGFQKMSNGGKIQISNFKNGLHKPLVRSRIIKLIGLVFFQFTKRRKFYLFIFLLLVPPSLVVPVFDWTKFQIFLTLAVSK